MKPESGILTGHPTRYWQAQPDGRFMCNLCPRYCQMRPGQRGFCYVRGADEHGVVLTTYGRSSGFCADPIEKKPLNHFYPGSAVLSFGTAGCNLGCKFCQNWDISKSKDMDTLSSSATPDAIAKAAIEAGCQTVAFTYNDPVIFAEYAIDTARVCRQQGIKTVVVSAGYITSAARPDFFEYMDGANIDLKAFKDSFYKKICFGSLNPVLETLKYLSHETDIWLEITNLIIPGDNDDDAEIQAMASWIAENLGSDIPLHFTAFHPDFRLRDRPPTPASSLRRARQLALAEGLDFVYVGNIHDRECSSTYCPNCGQNIIERDWYKIGHYHLNQAGQCDFCRTPIAGRFATQKGTWKAHRQPVKI